MSNELISATLVAGNTATSNLPKVNSNLLEIYIEGKLVDRAKSDLIAWITEEPKMPEVKIVNKSPVSLSASLTIEYDMDNKPAPFNYNRKFKDKYPKKFRQAPLLPTNPNYDNIESDMINIPPQGEWVVYFSEEIRGGKAIFQFIFDSALMLYDGSFTFYIRGKNPRKTDVLNYITQKGYSSEYWFFMKLIRHESGTHDQDEFLHFNPGSVSVKNETKGLPNWGAPHGLGLMQIDNKGTNANPIRATDDEVWNWKVNIDGAKNLLDVKKQEVINQYFIRNNINTRIPFAKDWNKNNPNDLIEQLGNQLEGKIIFGSIPTSISGVPQEINDYFNEHVKSQGSFVFNQADRSFFDAALIRWYNGGRYHVIKTFNPPINIPKPYWLLNRYSSESGYYVEKVCSEKD